MLKAFWKKLTTPRENTVALYYRNELDTALAKKYALMRAINDIEKSLTELRKTLDNIDGVTTKES